MKKWFIGVLMMFVLLGVTTSYAIEKNLTQGEGKLVAVQQQTQDIKDKLNFELNFPRLPEKKFNQVVKEIIDKEVTRFRADVVAVSQYMPKEERETSGFNQLKITYQVTSDAQINKSFVSILFAVESNLLGSAHPNMSYQALNFDLKTAEIITLKQFFKPDSNYIAILNEYCANQLSKKINQTADEIKQSAALKYAIWNIKPTGLLITFDEFPRVLGPITVLVPYNVLQSVLLPEAAHCFVKSTS